MPPIMCQGQFWWVDDNVIVLPENRQRQPHHTGGCVVVEGDASLALGGARVIVVPTSSQTDLKDVHDVVIPCPPAPLRECVAMVGHVQPVLRADLTNLVGRLPNPWPDRVLAGILLTLGVPIVDEDEPGTGTEDAVQF